MEYQYLTCLNWAFAQLGVGSSPALATNVPEMAYCNLVGNGGGQLFRGPWVIREGKACQVGVFLRAKCQLHASMVRPKRGDDNEELYLHLR